MKFQNLMNFVQFCMALESQAAQRLAWEDAAEMRIARVRAERQAAAQLEAMLDANPSGQLGHATLNDDDVLRDSGLL